MLSKPPYKTNKNVPVGQGKELTLVRTGTFYGLKIEGVRQENSSYKRGIVAIPNFYFYDNQTKAMIDFSDFKNVIDQTLVSDFFDLSLDGVTMDVKSSRWENLELSKKKISLDGTYTIDKYLNNILFVNVIEVDNIDSTINRYDKSYFTDTPEFVLDVSTSQPDTAKFSITNHLGENSKNSFNYLGVIPGDYIKINKSNSRYQVEDLFSDEEGKEVLILKGTLSQEDRITSLTDVSVFTTNPDKLNTNSFDNTKTGRCNITENGVVLCYDSHTRLQCELRKNKVKNIISAFSEGNFCPQETTTIQRQTAVDQLTQIARDTNTILSNMSSRII